jgi:hypothetical protein
MFGIGRKRVASGGSAPEVKPYFDAFIGLAMRLSQSLSLSEWATGFPETYTPEEAESIEATRQARSRLPYTTASRFVEELIQRQLCEIGLINWAGEQRTASYDEWGPDLPADQLESITSTFLKAWLCNSNPFVLLELADFLAEAGRMSEASETLNVTSKFPAYAKTMTMGVYEMAAEALTRELFPPGLSRDARFLSLGGSEGLYSPKVLFLLNEETERIQDKLDGLIEVNK